MRRAIPLLAAAVVTIAMLVATPASAATFTAGLTSVTGAGTDSGNNNGISASRVVAGATGGSLTQISVYVGAVAAAPSNHMQVAVYAEAAGQVPGALLAASGAQTLVANAWNTFSMPAAAVAANGAYWLGFNVDGAATQYKIKGPGKSVWRQPTPYGTWPTAFGTPTGTDSTFTYAINMTWDSGTPTTTPPPPTTTITPTTTTAPPTTTAAPPPPTGSFTIQGTKIIDPAGKEFIPVGANVNGPEFVWPGGTLSYSGLAQNYWHWNTIRLNVCWTRAANYPNWNVVWPAHPAVPNYNGCENGGGSHYPDNDDLDAIVNEYTAKRIVVMIDLQQFNPGSTLSSTNLSFARNWWTYTANRYKDNPYVWFNLINEPVGGAGTLAAWNTITNDLAGRVRATGARNIIVADGASVGQEADDWTCSADIPYQNSAALTYGPTLQATHGNMLFALHAYNEWGGATMDQYSGCSSDPATMQAQLDTRMSNFFNRVQAANLPLVIGEFGSRPAGQVQLDDWDAGQDKAVKTVFRIIPGRSIGALWWHGDNGGGYYLLNNTTNPYGCAWHEVGQSGCGSPSAFGQQLYDFARTVNP